MSMTCHGGVYIYNSEVLILGSSGGPATRLPPLLEFMD